MESKYFYISIVVIICLIVAWIIYSRYIKKQNDIKETFQEDMNQQITTDNVIKRDNKYEDFDNVNFTYNYASLGNGSIQKINEITQQVIDRTNINSKVIFFNEGLQPIEKHALNQDEFDEYGKFLVKMLNSVMDYTCFKFVNAVPIQKVTTHNQTKHQFRINTLYKHPDDKEYMPLSFIAIILHEQSYSECGEICGEQTIHVLTPDYVKGTGSTYIDTFMLLPEKTEN